MLYWFSTVVCTPYTYMTRYIDFVIIIGEGVYLPIEIDGLSKMIDYDNTHEQRYERFNDFLFRQNEIINRKGLDFNLNLYYLFLFSSTFGL